MIFKVFDLFYTLCMILWFLYFFSICTTLEWMYVFFFVFGLVCVEFWLLVSLKFLADILCKDSLDLVEGWHRSFQLFRDHESELCSAAYWIVFVWLFCRTAKDWFIVNEEKFYERLLHMLPIETFEWREWKLPIF